MSLVVGLSGAQGGGKSSLLKELMHRGYHVDQFRVSRAVQAELGWDSLDRVMESFRTMTEFQEEVYNQKYENDYALRDTPNTRVVLTERTFADILAYTQSWTWKFMDRGEINLDTAMNFLVPYGAKCRRAHEEIYNATLLLPLMKHVVFENDPHRAKEEDAARVYEDVERFARSIAVSHRVLDITAASIEARATQVENFLVSL